jgi:ubiquinol-cytochrome c reductase cytochrome b subunit
MAWIESRSGVVTAWRATFNPLVPSVARWRYALGAALVSSLAVQVITGLLLMCSYSPSSATAWGSTYYIAKVLTGGWFLRGLHGYSAHAMIVVAALHLASVVVAGVYRAPREVNWWIGLIMLGILVTFTLTGNALAWDQEGYWCWNVETSIAGGAPVIGPMIQRLVVGGTEMGNATLGRLYALHVGLLPLIVVLLLWGHIVLARRHARVRPPRQVVTFEHAWPSQVFYNMAATTVMLGAVSILVLIRGGAGLDAPADPSSQYPARPAWFFLWLFDLRKHFTGPQEFVATMLIPGSLAAVTLALPFFDRVLPRRFAHFLACSFALALISVAGYLTLNSMRVDQADPHYRESLKAADAARDRAYVLASAGIPPDGASSLLARDPLFHGWPLLESKCLGCHAFDGKGPEKQTAPDLKGFATRDWIRGLLEKPDSPRYFGNAAGCDGMAEWKANTKLSRKQLDDVADFVATFAAIPADATVEEWLSTPGVAEHPGTEPFTKDCGTCHVIPGLTEGGGTREAPDLFAYGSPRWLSRMILRPGAPGLYGFLEKKDQMPGFEGQLTDNDLSTIVRYLRDDYLGAPQRISPSLKPDSTAKK